MVRCALLMVDYKFLSQGFNCFIYEMCALITHKDLWASKIGYDVPSNMRHAIVVALQSLTALASTHLVKYYVIVIMYLAPVCFPGGFIGPTKSMSHFSNACRVSYGDNGISSLLDGFPTLWHTL
jgi:hypothetical protein